VWVVFSPRIRLTVGEDKMYHGTCRTRRFIKNVQPRVVAIIQFKESGGHTLEFENSDEEFRDWHCAQCKRRIEDSLMVRGLDRRVEEGFW